VLVFGGGPTASALLGHGPDDVFTDATGPTGKPVGPLTWVRTENSSGNLTNDRTLFLLGADSNLGRDEFLRLLDGAKVSLEVALLGTGLAFVLGATAGAFAGLVGGWADTSLMRLTEFVMGLPVLLLLVMLGTVMPQSIVRDDLFGLLPPGILSVVLAIGALTWFYPARLVRTQVRSVREREFVTAAWSLGAIRRHVVRSHLFPHLTPTLAAYATVAIATNVLLEASLTFLGVGVAFPTPSLGGLLTATWGTVFDPKSWDPATSTIWLTVIPTLAIFVIVCIFNWLAEVVRRLSDG
jgi:peptide/nickel transport system permease protein